MTNSNTYSPAIQAILDSRVYPRHDAAWGEVYPNLSEVLPNLGAFHGVPDAPTMWATIGAAAAAELRAV